MSGNPWIDGARRPRHARPRLCAVKPPRSARANVGAGGAAMAANLTIEMLPARHGDALWLEWGDPDHRHRMLVDGGPKPAVGNVRNASSSSTPATGAWTC